MLGSKDDSALLKARGLRLRVLKQGIRLNQPCAALNQCRCSIYSSRPRYCRQFECVVLKDQIEGRITINEALTIVRKAKRLAAKAAKILTLLGDTEDKLSLRQRYTRSTRRWDPAQWTAQQASEAYKLSDIMHRLNLLLSERFYPSSEQD